MPTVLSYTGAFPNGPFLQHLTGKTTTVQNYAFPGAVQPTATVTVLSSANAFPGMPFLQHLTGKTATVEDYTFAGAVWPLASSLFFPGWDVPMNLPPPPSREIISY